MSIATLEDAEALVLGLGLFAAGGGGLAERGRRYLGDLLAEGRSVRWQAIEDLDPATLTCSVFGMGSIAPHPPMSPEERRAFGVGSERVSRPWVRAVAELEAHLGERIEAIVPFELGPSNTIVAVDAAARSGRALVDGDYAGRALPKMSQALPAVYDLPVWPLAICDPWGNTLVMTDCAGPAVAERIGKMVSKVTKAVDDSAACSHAAFPLTAEAAARVVISGTLTASLAAGRAVMDARRAGDDAVAAALAARGGIHLISGIVSRRHWEDTADGYMAGETVIEGHGSFRGISARVWFLNEHHVCWLDAEPAAMSPDIIAVVTTAEAEPLSNAQIREGDMVSVLAFPGPGPFREGRALAATEPRHYGIDLDYVPVEQLHPPPA